MTSPDVHAPGADAVSIAYEFSKAGSLEADNPQVIVQRSRTAFEAIPDGSTFLLRADEDGVMHAHLVIPFSRRGGTYENAAFQVGTALAARAVRCPAPDLSDTAAVAELEVVLADPYAGSANQQGAGKVRCVT